MPSPLATRKPFAPRHASECAMKTEAKVQLAMAVVGIPVMMLVVWNPSGTTKWPNPFREALDSFSKGGR